MNLGDGLKLESQILNGKTRLILAPCGVQDRTNKPAGNKGRALRTTLKGKPQIRVLHSLQNSGDKTEQPVLKPRSSKVATTSVKPTANVLQELENKKLTPLIQPNVQQTKPNAGKAKSVLKKAPGVPKQRPQHKAAITAEDLRESLVCLTQEQFQQILMTINQNNKHTPEEHTADKDNDKQQTEEESLKSLLNAKEEEDNNSGTSEKNDPLLAGQPKEIQISSLFSTLGEREGDRSLQEAKKAQWKRELDEQVALKKKIREAEQEEIHLKHRDGRETFISERTPSSDLPKNTPLNESSTPDSMFKTSTGTDTTDSSPMERASSFSSPELHAAMRSAFVLGEAAPLDHPFSAVKRQQQKKWLEELNKQREEVAQRKLQERLKIQETEQHDLWAVHFDSFKKKEDYETPVPPINTNFQQSESPLSSLGAGTVEQQPSPVSSNEQPETRRSIEEDQVRSQKAGYLRTMTALLDPAQIEERDRKRQKQLEHRKAVAAQVEEKRKRKQLEDEQRQREEQEEEQRLAREREQLQKQFEQDTLRQKQKEEIQTMKTRELYQSMQRAQEEAQRIKQEQRMRNLVQKGHDVANLQKNAYGGSIYLDHSPITNCSSDVTPAVYQNTGNSVINQSVTALISPRKDTAVQTDDLGIGMKIEAVSYSNGPSWRKQQNASPDIPVEFTYKQSKAEQQIKKTKSQRDKSESSKENSNSDVYEPYARTEKQEKELGRKPDWNRNRPYKKYVPASERYPKGLQKQREESKVRRQMELLHLVEKNTSNNLGARKGHSPEKTPFPYEEAMKLPPEAKKEENIQKGEPDFKRSDSPPVPAVKNRLHQAQRRSNITPAPIVYSGNPVSTPINLLELDKQDTDRPPSSQFVPYVRTKEIYYLDPDAPMSRPSTHDPQYRHNDADQESRQVFSSDHGRDPLLNPNVIRNKDRQQAILRGLSELRKGLLQKRRELETGLMPDV